MTGRSTHRPWLRCWLLRSAYLIAFVALVFALSWSGIIAGERRGGIVTVAGYLLPLLLPVLMVVDYRHVRRNWRQCNGWGLMKGETQ